MNTTHRSIPTNSMHYVCIHWLHESWAWNREGVGLSRYLVQHKKLLFLLDWYRSCSYKTNDFSMKRSFHPIANCFTRESVAKKPILMPKKTLLDTNRIFFGHRKRNILTPSENKVFTTCSTLIYSFQVCFFLSKFMLHSYGCTLYAITVGAFCVFSSDWQFICIVVSLGCVLGAHHSDEFANSVSMLNGLWMTLTRWGLA